MPPGAPSAPNERASRRCMVSSWSKRLWGRRLSIMLKLLRWLIGDTGPRIAPGRVEPARAAAGPRDPREIRRSIRWRRRRRALSQFLGNGGGAHAPQRFPGLQIGVELALAHPAHAARPARRSLAYRCGRVGHDSVLSESVDGRSSTHQLGAALTVSSVDQGP